MGFPVYASDAELLAAAAALLDRLEFTRDTPREQRWRTTEQLANELEPCDREALDRLERVLREHEARCLERMERGLAPDALIRRAKYPDRTTALPLWGSVKHHGPPWPGQRPDRDDELEALSAALRVPDGAPRVFLSHTHHDADLALRVAEALAKMGIGSWRFESHIERREDIADCVRKAIYETAATAALVTRHSIASLWVLTELHTRLTARGMIVLLVDAADQELLRLLESVKFNYPDGQFDTSVKYETGAVNRLQEDYAHRESASRVERYSKQVGDFLASLPAYLRAAPGDSGTRDWRPLLAFPHPPAKWTGQVRIGALGELPAILTESGGAG
jgi:TIR domain-containing protein